MHENRLIAKVFVTISLYLKAKFLFKFVNQPAGNQSFANSVRQIMNNYAKTAQLILSFSLLIVTSSISFAQSFSFVALGDHPYGVAEKSYPPYRALISAINRAQPAFSIHVGDFKSGSTVCSDQEFLEQFKHFSMFEQGVVYTPGDNEWTDCHRRSNGGYDPLERLGKIRQLFYNPTKSLGMNPITLVSQAQIQPAFSAFVENQRWVYNDVLFVTLHIVGSNNNFETRDPKAIKEFFERDAANIAWIQAAFDEARNKNLTAIVFAYQADVLISRSMWEDFPAWSGFRNSVGETLLPLAREWSKPVLLIHGDRHQYHFDQLFKLNNKLIDNLTRLQVLGASDVRAVKVQVDSTASSPFSVGLLTP